ncbi:MAG: BON domain-containing protein [Gammaproteobacteria bacterium]
MDAVRNIASVCLILSLCWLIEACAANAAITGAQAVYNRHSIKNNLSDHYIALKAERDIYLDSNRFQNTNVSVASFNGVVLIAGQVPHSEQRKEVAQIVKKIPGINELHNLLSVSTPTSALTRVSDTWITAKIKSKLIAINEIDPDQIKVVTENGTVYLMGIIPHEQADIAVDLARTTDGVQSVVKIFSYLYISKT